MADVESKFGKGLGNKFGIEMQIHPKRGGIEIHISFDSPSM